MFCCDGRREARVRRVTSQQQKVSHIVGDSHPKFYSALEQYSACIRVEYVKAELVSRATPLDYGSWLEQTGVSGTESSGFRQRYKIDLRRAYMQANHRYTP